MTANKVLQVSALAGKIILENGGEVYRVEETISRICHAFDIKNVDSFATPTGLMMSLVDNDGHTHSLIKRITSRGVNLDKIHQVNNLSRKLSLETLTLDEVYSDLKYIESQKPFGEKIMIFFSALGAASFTFLFKGTIYDFLCAFFIGLLIKVTTLVLKKIQLNDFFINIIGGAISALLGYSLKSLGLGDNMDTIIISSIMLLVPGMIITNAIRDIIAGDLVSGTSRLMEAFFIAVAIASGTGLVFKLIFLFGGIIL